MKATSAPGDSTDPQQLIHSIHNTGRSTTKVVLVTSELYNDAIDQFANLENIMMCHIHPTYHGQVFVPGARPGLAGQQVDSLSSCNYSSYASELLSKFNPQDGDTQDTVPQVKKRFRTIPMTYASVVTTANHAASAKATATTSVSSLSNNDMDKLYEEMSKRLCATHGDFHKLNISDLEQKVQQTSTDIHNVRRNLEQSIQDITSSVKNLATKVDTQHCEMAATVRDLKDIIERQNFCILGIQQDFKDNIAAMSEQLQQVLKTTGTNPVSPAASTRAHGHWGEPVK
jgi:hypothetical protein